MHRRDPQGTAQGAGRGQRRQPQQAQDPVGLQVQPGVLPKVGGHHRGGAQRAQEEAAAQTPGKAGQDCQWGKKQWVLICNFVNEIHHALCVVQH